MGSLAEMRVIRQSGVSMNPRPLSGSPDLEVMEVRGNVSGTDGTLDKMSERSYAKRGSFHSTSVGTTAS